MIELTPHQWRLLNACVIRHQRSTHAILNTSRSLVRLGLIERYSIGGGRIMLGPTNAGRAEWFEQMRSRQRAEGADSGADS